MAKTIGKHSKKETKTRKIPIFRLISIVIILACGIYIWNWVKENNHSNEVMQIAKEAVTVKKENNEEDESKEVITVDFEKLKKIHHVFCHIPKTYCHCHILTIPHLH